MGTILSVQVSFFCAYHIKTTIESVTQLMQLLNQDSEVELLPSFITGQLLKVVEEKVQPTTNLMFSTTTGSIQIICMDNRIDCTIKSEIERGYSWEAALEDAGNLVKQIVEQYGIQGSRLAVNIDVIGNELKNFEGTQFSKSLLTHMGYYKGKELADMTVRLNTRESIQLAGAEEKINIITNINSAINQTNNKILIYHIDINTIPENVNLRFTGMQIVEYVNRVKEIVKQIIKDIEVTEDGNTIK